MKEILCLLISAALCILFEYWSDFMHSEAAQILEQDQNNTLQKDHNY